jgi:segregation and condensation protein B
MPITDEQLKSIIEAAIMAAGEPLSIDKILTLFVEEKEPPTRDAVKEAIKLIETECETRGVELKKVSSGYRFQAKKDFTPWVSRLWEEKPARYSRALLETMVLIAYKQPLTRGEIEHVRGVAVSTHIIKTLLEREWVRVVGHRDVPGKPALYATTKAFLDYFNLKSLEELPTLSEIRDLDKINAELDLQEPGAEQAEAGEEGEGLEELAQADTGEAIAEVEAGEEGASDQIVEEPSAEAQSEEVPSAEAVSEDSLSTEAAGAEVIEEVTEEFSDEEIDSNQDDRDDVMLDEHDKEMESRLALEEEEIIASIDTAENESEMIVAEAESSTVEDSENKLDEIEDVMMAESDVSSENELVESTEPESAIEEDSKVENSVVAETVENKEQKLETAAMESDDYSEMEDVDSKFAS